MITRNTANKAYLFNSRMRSNVCARHTLTVIVALLLAPLPPVTAGPAPMAQTASVKAEAEAILKQSGVRGGLLVLVPFGDGSLAAELHGLAAGRFLVHGLNVGQSETDSARAFVQQRKLAGLVSVDSGSGARLPYDDDLVNLLILDDGSRQSRLEALRVLVPGGVLLQRQDGGWARHTKPRPTAMDEWTHYLYDGNNNAVSGDELVASPRHLKWKAMPDYVRHHEHKKESGINAMVSSGGRIFTMQDEGEAVSIYFPSKWVLVARDAMNGLLLWKRPLMTSELTSLRVPGSHPQGLVAVGDRVYVSLGLGEPVSCLDAATGETLRVYEDSEGTTQIVHHDGRLFVATNNKPERILAYDTESAQPLWRREDKLALPLSLATDGSHVVFRTLQKIVCLDPGDGRTLWTHGHPLNAKVLLAGPVTMVLSDGVVLCATRPPGAEKRSRDGILTALDMATGRELWTRPCKEGWHSPVDVFVVDGTVWYGATERRGHGVKEGEPDFTEGLDLRTGKVVRKLDTSRVYVKRPHHHRCHREKATKRFLISGRHGVEFSPWSGDRSELNDWVRGGCQYGVMPANGLIYVPQNPCRCHIGKLLHSFMALAPALDTPARPGSPAGADAVIEKGPAFRVEPKAGDAARDGWPTLRHDPSRSGYTQVAVDRPLKQLWRTELGPGLTSVVVAEDRLLVARKNAHTVYALEAHSGRRLWSYTAGGRVDSPPTLHRGRALFGAADGWIYCLSLADGRLAWRLRAAPDERRIVVDGRLESPWPVHGSVLVQDDRAYAVAGRSPHLDGGMLLRCFDPLSGKVLDTQLIDHPVGEGGLKERSDVLSCDESNLYMRTAKFPLPLAKTKAPGREAPHLIRPTGMLDATWWHRTHWVYSKKGGGPIEKAGMRFPAAKILSFDGHAVFGYGLKPGYFMWTSPVEYRLFAADREPATEAMTPPEKQPPQKWLKYPDKRFATRWSMELPFHARAMVQAGDALILAGPRNVARQGPPKGFADKKVVKSVFSPAQAKASLDAWQGASGALLHIVSTANGKTLSELTLKSPPIFDGMAAAGGMVYFSAMDGSVNCLGGAR